MYYESENYLAHHGIKHQKWGNRRFQNEDGSLTERSHKVLNKTPMRRFGNITELNGIVCFLASDEASWVNGHIMIASGATRVV